MRNAALMDGGYTIAFILKMLGLFAELPVSTSSDSVALKASNQHPQPVLLLFLVRLTLMSQSLNLD